MPVLFRLLGLPDVIEYLTVEFPLHEKVFADLVVRLADGRILHIELQSRNDVRMPFRCLEYWRVIAELWPDADIVQVVIYAGDGPMTMASGIDRGRLTYGFDILNVQDLDAGLFLESTSDSERMLAALCHSDDPRATIAAILRSWRHLPAKEFTEKLEDLLVLSQIRKRDTIVTEESTEMPIEIDITENAMFKWGEEKGEARGEAKILTRFLERRFGPLPDAVKARIASADTQTIERWVDRMDGAAASLDEVLVP